MTTAAQEITLLVERARNDRDAEDRLYRRIEDRFRRIAGNLMKNERPNHTLQETVLITDSFRALVINSNHAWESREQFFCAAAKTMRRLLIDYARARIADKRGGGVSPENLANVAEPADSRQADDPSQLLAIDEIVAKLEDAHPEVFKVFNLHYFMGFELKEVAEDILDVPYTTIKRRWKLAKGFLHRELTAGD